MLPVAEKYLFRFSCYLESYVNAKLNSNENQVLLNPFLINSVHPRAPWDRSKFNFARAGFHSCTCAQSYLLLWV